MPPLLNVFISYAHKDDKDFGIFKAGLIQHLDKSENFKFIVWDDTDINIGSDWNDVIQQQIEQAEIAIFCVSDNFFESKYIISSELNKTINNCPDTLSIPIFYGRIREENWKILSRKQFSKAKGRDFGFTENKEFTFCDLVRNNNENVDAYLSKLAKDIEKAYVSKNYAKGKLLPVKPEENILARGILAVAGFSFIWLVFSVFKSDAIQANPPLSLTTLFGSIMLYMKNRNQKPTNIAYA